MIGEPKFKREQQVRFSIKNADGEDFLQEGVIYIVDADGTSEQQEEPSYDIMALVDGEKVLFKHIRESLVEERE